MDDRRSWRTSTPELSQSLVEASVSRTLVIALGNRPKRARVDALSGRSLLVHSKRLVVADRDACFST
jgi:hypothetical protein